MTFCYEEVEKGKKNYYNKREKEIRGNLKLSVQKWIKTNSCWSKYTRIENTFISLNCFIKMASIKYIIKENNDKERDSTL